MKESKGFFSRWIVLAVFLIFAGCATTGEDFNYEGVKKLEKGKTTKEQTLQLFGTPHAKGIDNGRDRWTYEFNKKALGGKLYHKDVVLIFNEEGKVIAYSHESNFP